MDRKALFRVGAALTAVLIVFAACSGGDEEGAEGGGAGEEPVGAPALEPAEGRGQAEFKGIVTDEAGQASAGEPTATKLPRIGPSVIKTADLGVEVGRGDFRDSLQEAVSIAGKHGGYVLSTTTSGEKARDGSLVMRVPADNFTAALDDLKELGEVTSEGVHGEDVSQEFIDLEARLRNLKAQEAVMLRLMDQAQTVTDTIRVQNELTGIQLDIERIKGRLRYLEDQTSLSTISVALREAGAPAPGKANALSKAWDRAVDVALGIVAAVIVGVGAAVPLLILALLGLLGFKALRPRVTTTP